MAAKGYATTTTTGQVSKWYGAELTAAQAAQATAWLEAAEQIIDTVTRQPFATGAVTGERHYPAGPYRWLRKTPVSSVTAVRGYHRGSTTATLLTLTAQFEVDDLPTGRLYLPGWPHYAYFTVDYTPVA